MEKIKITVNGKEIEVSPQQTILEAVHEHGIDRIPTLCHDPKLPPYGSCYLCVVEVQGMNKLIPSCASPVSPGMVITTDNERIRKARKTALELLLSNHYADCLGPCKLTCPAGVDVQGYIALMAMGKHKEAVRLIKETNPLPLVCGRVCVRECEVACRRNRVDDRVGIDYLKRFASDLDIEDPWTPELPEKNGKHVAVVGGGPAGLTCAYYLLLKGYGVTLYEKAPHLGGMLRYGIPEYRLPKAMLDKEIGWITGLGVEVKLKQELGRDFSLDDLKSKYDAVFLAFGAQGAKTMRLKDEDTTTGIIPGIGFLWQLQSENPPEIFGKVVVVGGGNTAIDAARSAVRLGADQVTLLYRRTRKEMPAHEMEIEAALHEGVVLVELAAPVQIVSENGSLKALECIRMELGEPDASGRRSPVPKAGSEYRLDCDFAISAIGQDVELCGLEKSDEFKSTRWSTPVIDEATLETSIPGVFTGGDMATGPSVAIAAIAHGKIAANAIDHRIQSGRAEGTEKEFISRKDDFGEIPEVEFSHYPSIVKERMPELPVDQRIDNFREVETGFTSQQVENECSRCLECGCSAYFECDLRMYATQFGVDISKYLGEVKKYKVDRNHPYITLDPNKCIACGRCVRTCSEVLQVSALGFVYRGFKAVVKPSMEKPLLETNCISCGNCIGACPTGAISEKLPFRKPGPWKMETFGSVCQFCSIGCNLNYKVFDESIYTVDNANGDSHNKGYLCYKGRFGHRFMQDESRLTRPLIRRGGKLVETDWGEAIEFAATGIGKILKNSGGEGMAVTASPRSSNEELFALQLLARSACKSNRIGSFSRILNPYRGEDLLNMAGAISSSADFTDLQKADLIIVLNANLTEENLVAELKVKEARKKGVELATFLSWESTLAKDSELWIDNKRGTSAMILAAVACALIDKGAVDRDWIDRYTSGFEDFFRSIESVDISYAATVSRVKESKLRQLYNWFASRERNIVILSNIDSSWERSSGELQAALSLLMITGRLGKPGNGLILLSNYANTQGLFNMGFDSRFLPGQVSPKDEKNFRHLAETLKINPEKFFPKNPSFDDLIAPTVDGMLIWGEDPLSDPARIKWMQNLKFLVVSDFFLTATAERADVVLPLSTLIETGGTITSSEGRIQEITPLFPPKSGRSNLEIIHGLAEGIGDASEAFSVHGFQNRIAEFVPEFADRTEFGLPRKSFRERLLEDHRGDLKLLPLPIELAPGIQELSPPLSSETYLIQKIKNNLL